MHGGKASEQTRGHRRGTPMRETYSVVDVCRDRCDRGIDVSSVCDVAVPELGKATIADPRSQMKFFRASSSFQRGPSGSVSLSRCYAVS